MDARIKAPKPVFDPGKGLLHNEHFQIAYVTNDIEQAADLFRRRFGVPAFRESDADLPSGAAIRVRAARIGNMLYELISGTGPGMELWATDAAEAGFILRHHHFGFLIPNEEVWQRLEEEIERGKWVVRQRSHTAAYGRALTVEAPELGHFLEYILPGPELIARFESTPGA